MKILRHLALLVLVSVLAACNPGSNIRISGDAPLKHLTIEDDRVGIRSTEGDMAWIEADGSLRIGNQPVAVDASQRALALGFYTEAQAVHDEGVAIGKSGAAMAGKSIRTVVRGLTRGNPDSIGPEIEAEARELEATAMRLCRRIGTLQSVQDELAAALPAFAPFASIKDVHIEDCASDEADADQEAEAASGDTAASPQH